MPDRLYLGREGSGYDFSFTRYAAPDQGDVCGMVRFSLTMGLPSGVVDKATRMLSESEPKTDPYWGSRYYYREAYTPLTFRYTHTTLSDVAAGSDRIARTLPGAAPWYCENQGADTGPLQATESRSYTTLLGRYHTELFHQAVVQDTQSAPAVNRALGIEFQAPVNSFSLAADWPAVREELLRGTRGAERDVTLDQIRGAVHAAPRGRETGGRLRARPQRAEGGPVPDEPADLFRVRGRPVPRTCPGHRPGRPGQPAHRAGLRRGRPTQPLGRQLEGHRRRLPLPDRRHRHRGPLHLPSSPHRHHPVPHGVPGDAGHPQEVLPHRLPGGHEPHPVPCVPPRDEPRQPRRVHPVGPVRLPGHHREDCLGGPCLLPPGPS